MFFKMTQFESLDGKLYIEGYEVIRAFESWNYGYWFATKEQGKQDTVLNGKIYKNDTIYFGYVQGWYDEWGSFSLAELESLKPYVWEIRQDDLPFAGRRESRDVGWW